MAKKTLEELVLKLTADNQQILRKLGVVDDKGKRTAGSLRRSFSGLDGVMGGLGKKIAAVAVAYAGMAGARALTGQIRESLDFADSIDKAAGVLDVSTDALQRWRFGADQSGVSANVLDKAIKKLGEGAADYARGIGEAADAFRELDVKVLDANGNLRSTEAIFEDTIRALGEEENGVKRLGQAVDLFGSRGAGVLNLAKDFDELSQKAEDLGLVLDRQTIAAAVEAKDKLAQLALKARVELTPSLVDLATALVDISDELVVIAQKGVGAFAWLTDVLTTSNTEKVENLVAGIERTKREIEDLEGQQGNLGFFENFFGFGDQAIRQELIVARERLARFQSELSSIPISSFGPSLPPSASPVAGSGGVSDPVDDAADRAAERAAEKRRQAILDTRREASEVERLVAARQHGIGVYEAMARQIELENEARAAGIELGTEEFGQFAKAFDQREQWQDQLKAIETTEKKSAEAFSSMAKEAESYANQSADALAQMVVDMEFSFDRLGKAIAQQFLSNQFRGLTAEIFGTGAGGTSILGSLAGSIFGGPTAAAGAGKASVAPQLYLPQVGATSKAGGAGSYVAPVSISIENNSKAEVGASEQMNSQGERQIQIWIEEKQSSAVRRGALDGPLNERFGLIPKGV